MHGCLYLQEAYLEAIFYPGRFASAAIRRTLELYGAEQVEEGDLATLTTIKVEAEVSHVTLYVPRFSTEINHRVVMCQTSKHMCGFITFLKPHQRWSRIARVVLCLLLRFRENPVFWSDNDSCAFLNVSTFFLLQSMSPPPPHLQRTSISTSCSLPLPFSCPFLTPSFSSLPLYLFHFSDPLPHYFHSSNLSSIPWSLSLSTCT